jgi:hypothetical protein
MQLAPDVPITATTVHIAGGVRGVWQTLAAMRQMVNKGRKDPAILKASHACVYLAPEKSPDHELQCIFQMVRDNVRYVSDVLDVETLRDASKTLQGRQGDCDDQVILLCSLFESIGYPTRFVIAGYNDPGIFEHVYCQVFANGQWIDCDPTEREPLGWAPPSPLAYAIERV